MLLTLTLALVFVGTCALVAGGAMYADRKRLAEARAIRARLAAPLPGLGGADGAVKLVRAADRLSGFAFLERALTAWEGTGRARAMLRRAGVERTVGEYVLASAAGGALGLSLGTQLGGGGAAALALAATGALAPTFVLAQRAKARAAAFEKQLPEALDAIVNSLKAGYSFPAALEFASGEVPAPLGPELARVRDEQRLGLEARPALIGLADRVNTSDMRMFVTAVLVQRETGGNLADLLGDLAALVRDRSAFRGRVGALTAEPRMSALVLAALPVILFVGMRALNPGYMAPMTETPHGRLLLTAAAVLTAGGYLVMRKLGDVEL